MYYNIKMNHPAQRISSSGDGDEMGVSFNKFITFQMVSVLSVSVYNKPLWLSADRVQDTFEKHI